MKYLFFAMRPRQWVKNLFIFLPLIFGKELFVFPVNLKVFLASLLFSLCAGAVYLINDILDLEKDKIHPSKRSRVIASGKINPTFAWGAAIVIAAFSMVLSFFLGKSFGCVVAVYFVFNLLYSKVLKEIVILDVFSIGVFFLLRLQAGSVVANLELSHWIIFMTALLALFLGFTKRRQEIHMLGNEASTHREVLEKYNSYFIDQMIAVITSSIVVVYMLYTVDARTVHEIGSRSLVFSIPFVYYGIFRYYFLIHKMHSDGDPTGILFSDGKMLLNLFLWILVCIACIYKVW